MLIVRSQFPDWRDLGPQSFVSFYPPLLGSRSFFSGALDIVTFSSDNARASYALMVKAYLAFRLMRDYLEPPRAVIAVGLASEAWAELTSELLAECVPVSAYEEFPNVSLALAAAILFLHAHALPRTWPAALLTPARVRTATRLLTNGRFSFDPPAEGDADGKLSKAEHLRLKFHYYFPAAIACERCSKTWNTRGRARVCALSFHSSGQCGGCAYDKAACPLVCGSFGLS